VDKLFAPLRIFLGGIIGAPENPLGGEKPLYPYRAPSMYSTRGDSNFSS